MESRPTLHKWDPLRPVRQVGCQLCGGMDQPSKTLLCDAKGCTQECHLACLGLTKVPDGDWFCPR